MSISTTAYGINLIKKHEGLRLSVYLCPGGFWTIGYGHKMQNNIITKITESDAEVFLINDLRLAEKVIHQGIKQRLYWHQFDALASFIYNIGGNAFLRSTLRHKINYNQPFDVEYEFLRWSYCRGKKLLGLTARRRDEGKLFIGLY
jgi:lysozyme